MPRLAIAIRVCPSQRYSVNKVMTAVEKKFMRDEEFLRPLKYFEDDSDDTEDDFEDLLSALNEVKDLRKELSQQNQSFNEELKSLSQAIRIESARSESLTQNVENLGHKVDELTKVVKSDSLKTMRDQLDNLSTEWKVIAKVLNFDANLLDDLGIVAVCIEQAICSHVLPEIFINDSDAGLHDLLGFLNSDEKPITSDLNELEQVLCTAKKRWETVCEGFNFPEEWKTKSGEWSAMDCTVPGDIRAIEVLKLSRVSTNIKPISLKHAEKNIKSIKDELPPWQFELVATFIGSLREKMTRIGLYHDCLYLD